LDCPLVRGVIITVDDLSNKRGNRVIKKIAWGRKLRNWKRRWKSSEVKNIKKKSRKVDVGKTEFEEMPSKGRKKTSEEVVKHRAAHLTRKSVDGPANKGKKMIE